MLRTRIKSNLWLLCLLLSACNSSPNAPVASPAASPSSPAPSTIVNSLQPAVNPVFQPILPELQHPKQRLQVLLPTYIPEAEGRKSIYAIAEKSTPIEYSILLAFSKDCSGGTACRLGGMYGELITGQTPPIVGKKVILNDSIPGYFVEAKCNANCSDATLSWEQNGGRYTVALKAGRLDTLVQMANSAIASPKKVP